MATIAVYNLKGGVGKTTLAVNLAWCSAAVSKRRTLLWDLDPQAAATWLLSDAVGGEPARAVFAREIAPEAIVRRTAYPGLDLLPSDISLRDLDQLLIRLGKRKRLARLTEELARRYDRIILDCPPGLTEISDQMLRAADIVVAPVVPARLARRAFDEVVAHLERRHARRAAILPVFSMVDRRRTLHNAALADEPDWPVVPMASAVEAMTERRAPLASFAPASPAAQAFARLWAGIEHRLAR